MAWRPQATQLKVTVMTEWTPGPASPTEWPVTPGAFFHRGSERSGSTARPGPNPVPTPVSSTHAPTCCLPAVRGRRGVVISQRTGSGVHPLSGQHHTSRETFLSDDRWLAGWRYEAPTLPIRSSGHVLKRSRISRLSGNLRTMKAPILQIRHNNFMRAQAPS